MQRKRAGLPLGSLRDFNPVDHGIVYYQVGYAVFFCLSGMGDKAIAKKSPLALFGASIGYSFRFYLQGLVGNAGVKMLAVDGVSPSAEHIRDRSYPLVYPFYVIYRADNRNGNIPLLVDWLLSEEGQALLEQTGYVGLGEAPVS